MVKLASARDFRMYGTRLARNRSEYVNAGLYVFSTIMLLGGFAAQLSSEPKSGLVLMLIGFAIVFVVNVHDLVAHLAGIDFRLGLVEYDLQLALVELAVPVVCAVGAVLLFLATLFIFIQSEKGYGYFRLERHALNMLLAGPMLWLLGSIHNSCQIYDRADGHVQMLQESIHIPFLLASLLFVVGGIMNRRNQHIAYGQHAYGQHGIELLGSSCIWLGIFGSLILFIGVLANVVKVFKMQQPNGLRLEKLRGGVHERLAHIREGHMPLIAEEKKRLKPALVIGDDQRKGRPSPVAMEEGQPSEAPTPYKDVLVGHT